MNENREESGKSSQLEAVSVDPLTSEPKKQWVKFDDDSHQDEAQSEKKAIEESSKHLNTKYNEIKTITGEMGPAVIDVPTAPSTIEIELPKSQQQSSNQHQQQPFHNGEIIVTLLPVNEKFPWITPATFRPELVPEELMSQGLTLTVEEYVAAIEILVNDYRFTLYNICYKRVLMLWIMLAFVVLLALLFSGITGILLFSLGVSWLFLNAMAIFVCMWIKLKLNRGLEKCLARVNKLLLRHKIIIALDDRGNISCHKVHLCFIYFDAAQCISYINNFLERRELNGVTHEPGWETRLDIDSTDIVIQGSSSNNTRISRQQDLGLKLVLRYGSRWGKLRARNYLKVTNNDPARHMRDALCACQFIENHLKCKPQGSMCWPTLSNDNHLYPY